MHTSYVFLDLQLIIGMRVRVTKNLGTQVGIYQGSLGTIHSFLFDESDDIMSDDKMFPKNIPAWRLAMDGPRQNNRPVVIVKMDRIKNDITCLPGESSLVSFVPITHYSDIKTHGYTYHRVQYPLAPAQATTMHKVPTLTLAHNNHPPHLPVPLFLFYSHDPRTPTQPISHTLHQHVPNTPSHLPTCFSLSPSV